MNRVEKIENFSKLGYGLFIHFGVFSELDSGEWIWAFYNNKSKDVRVAHTDSKRVAIDDAFARWQPNQFDAKKIVSFAKRNGFRYITFTTRHHEGVSLYDTKGLSPIDITHKFKGRDFVKEIVDECHEQGVKIFLYHTLIDWYVPEFKDDIKKYLVYLRSSIELLCRNYGKIDGFWFDGSWTPYVADWEFEKLFKLIKTYQPDAMLINNGGLEAEGKALHEEWEVITFEQDDKVFDRFIKPKNYGLEICETLNDHWGVASRDYNYKALPYFIKKIAKARSKGFNYLLNIGLNKTGTIVALQEAMIDAIGTWIQINGESLFEIKTNKYLANSTSSYCCDAASDNVSYLFMENIKIDGLSYVTKDYDEYYSRNLPIDIVNVNKEVKAVECLDNNEQLYFYYNKELHMLTVVPSGFSYGTQLVVRVAKILYK